MTKYCCHCGQDKPVRDYYKNTGRKDGLSVYCASCTTAVSKESYLKLRNQAIDQLGSKCARCGYDHDRRALQIDHVNGDGRAQRRKDTRVDVLRAVLVDTEGRYQLLCANCNQIKRFEAEEHGARVYTRQVPTLIDRPNQRWTPEARAAQAERTRKRWAEDEEFRASTSRKYSEAMKRRWASGEVPSRPRRLVTQTVTM